MSTPRWINQPNTMQLTFDSDVLKNNPLNDPTTRDITIYLPPDYDSNKVDYPVIWFLPPLTSWGRKMLNVSPWEENIIQIANRLIQQKKIQPVIIAMPNCFTLFGGSQYLNSSAVGQYRDYLLQELIPFVDAQLNTRASSEHRAVMGYSSGGYGALMLAIEEPEYFSAVASHSGDMFFETCYRPDFPSALRALEDMGGLETFLSTLPEGPQGSSWFDALNIVAMSACYSPNTRSKYGFDLPFDVYTGEINQDIWQQWVERDPVMNVSEAVDELKELKALYIDCGNHDEFNLFLGARLLSKTLSNHAIPHTYEEFEGGHRRISWRYEISLPILVNAIAD